MKHLLTIAGSDSSGGAGIQADLKTFSALGAYGLSVICAVTAQNTRGVVSYEKVSKQMIAAQIDAVFDDIPIDAVKVGMLGDAETVHLVAERLRHHAPSILVVDPVMTAKSGHRLLDTDAEERLLNELLPLATLATPNIPEAAALWGQPVNNSGDMIRAATFLHHKGIQAVLVKGGHLGEHADDLLLDTDGIQLYKGERLEARHTHGTGCSLSSALAVYLACGIELRQAAGLAKSWVREGIREGLAVGSGCGPIHHFHDFFDRDGNRR